MTVVKNNKPFKKILAIILCFLLLFSVAGCNQQLGNGTDTAVADTTPVAGGTMQIGCVEPETLNPILTKEKSYIEICSILFESLYKYDDSLKLKPSLIESFNRTDSNKVIITIKSQAVWSNGSKITANDIKFTIDSIKTGIYSAYKIDVSHIMAYKVINEEQLEIDFDQTVIDGREFLVFPIIPAVSFYNNPAAVPITSGSYKIAAYNKINSLELTKNEKWIGENKPYIENIKVVFINDLAAYSTAFQSRELEALNVLSYDWGKYNDIESVKSYTYVTMNCDFLGFNFANPLLSDLAVRSAIAKSINKKALVDKYLLGNGVVTDVPINPNSWLADGKDSKDKFSIVDAQNTIKAAGFTDSNNDGILDRTVNGVKQELRFTLITNQENDFRKKAIEDIKKSLQEAGIKVDIKIMPYVDFTNALYTRSFDMVLAGYNISPYQNLAFALQTSPYPDSKNYWNYSNSDFDSLFLLAATAIDDSTKKEVYLKIQEKFRNEIPFVNICFRKAALVVRDRIKGDLKPTTVNYLNNIESWNIKKELQ